MRPPRIGVTTRSHDPAWVERKTRPYLTALERAGAQAIVLGPREDVSAAARLEDLAGVLFSGGGDIDPKHYGESPSGTELDGMDAARDAFELELARRALDQDLPVLGICRGFQLLNVVLGGTLAQHVDHHRVGGGSWAQHRVRLAPHTKLRAMFSGPELVVNSRHHQAVTPDRLAPGLVTSALTLPDDGVIEAFESSRHTWTLAVQWHPESVEQVPAEQAAIFDALVSAARRRAQ
jgi:putative glutamine amidotransferase